MIKIGCNSLSMSGLSVEDFVRTCYDLRLDSVDFHESAFASRDHEYLQSVKLLCLRYGLPIVYVGVSGLFHGAAGERRALAAKAKEAIDLAAFLGAPLIRMFCATVPERNADGEPAWPAMIAGYREVADYGAARGVSVGLQNHPVTGTEMLRIRADVDRANFNFIVDTGQWTGSPGTAPLGVADPAHDFYAYLQQTVPYAVAIRTKFYRIESGREEWLDYERIVSIIRGANYNGCLSIVYEGEQADRTEQVRLGAAYLRELLAGDRP